MEKADRKKIGAKKGQSTKTRKFSPQGKRHLFTPERPKEGKTPEIYSGGKSGITTRVGGGNAVKKYLPMDPGCTMKKIEH